MNLPPECDDKEPPGWFRAIVYTLAFLTAFMLIAALSSCTCTLNGEEAAKSVVYIYKYATK